ncbi:MAG: PKD domain-containing protein [Planctomycetota bacterium]|nr:PKD domain-containing protein [Planctomycetota bacterium]
MATTQPSFVLSTGRLLSRSWLRLAVVARVAVLATCGGFLVGLLVAFVFTWESEELTVRVAPLATEGSTHLALDGEAVLLKAVLSPRPGHVLEYTWAFGDESEPVTGIVTNPFGVSAVHTYPESEVGAVYTATLTIRDKATGDVAETHYPVRFVEPTTENKRSIVLDDALWALHASMERTEDYVHGPIGRWSPRDYPLGSTAMAVLSFEVNGFDARDEREGNPYQDTVDRGLTYLLNALERVELTAQPAGDPDSNGNGIGLIAKGSDRPLYEVPLVAMALVASQAPDRVAWTGGEDVRGRTFRELVVDMLDYLAFAQVDPNRKHRGGWRYRANAGDADMSVTQWPVLAFMSAREVWGIEAPDFVKTELRDHFLATSQAAHGGFQYQPGRGANVGLTGAGLIALAFADVPADDDRVVRAKAYIEQNWSSANVGDFYNMYAIMKGALLTQGGIETFGEHDWLTTYVEHLHANQQDLGHWTHGGRWASGTRLTAWPALIISKDVFATSRPATIAWGLILGLSLVFLVLVIVVVRWFRVRAA